MQNVLDSRVLVLNKNYSPIRTTSVREAFIKIFSEAAEVITVEDGVYMNYDFGSWSELSEFKQLYDADDTELEFVDWINTPNTKLVVPRVIRLTKYDKMPKYQLRLTRKNIYERDEYRCQYCGNKYATEDLNLDHVVPRSKGGKNTWTNLVCSCISCNRKKKAHTLKEAGMKLRKKPVKPHENFAFRVSSKAKKYKDWSHFLSDAYFNVTLDEG